ncbi:iron-siderophore ABC transporter substrate-binding protein [Mesorhizobium sp. M3A.F.Ca.ET.174.01.1.1]|nr:iron-siderophore ABC transporter substrate-binding protein [Mesorhizobium sp. M3A.F.Ca.ET.080.04.2.1]PBB85356.1 ABC transporter substrate-binding protein [Mesorhizobium sp. WSM3876]RWE27555.1 MAG: iron-siderophore ABC transporter substrate-binding protein [Mesorhizobium sp.]TGS62844.1 iron-siderophore ABC transporter substrate-binding protein [Mesorhizobium sp. M3A.F.Ca.ET.201.01.1.1]TGS84792.1 iron-siderophore ABC transporter substrate-binding protein [Mesorhizobium sp. M3A.F.Ca.ET.175.01.1
MSRRRAFGLFTLPFAAIGTSSARTASLRIACLDDGLAETLLMLGVRPIAIADREVWEKWVVEPALPPEVADIGTLLEPNLEFLAQLKPDVILAIPYLDGIKPLLERVAPVKTIGIYTEGGQPYRNAVDATRKLASLVGKVEEGEALIAATEAYFAKVKLQLAPLSARPLYVVSFMDPRNVRVYGQKSLFQEVFDRIGIRNAWTGETNYWGFATVGIDGLATDDDARLAYLEPLPEGAGGTLTTSPVWDAMPFVRNRSIMRLPPVLMFGALPSAARFARVLAEAMAAHG